MIRTLLLSVCFLTFFTSTYAATITWDGGAGTTAWEDAMNWSTDALPTTADDVDINGATVVLSTAQQVERVYVRGGGQLTVMGAATLTITGFGLYANGLETTTSATIINDGTIAISNINGGTGADGIYSRNVFTNNGTISIDGTGQHGIYMVGGTFTNSAGAMITVTNAGQMNTAGDNIYVDDSGGMGNFVNDGSISITMTTGDDGIYVNDGTTFNNNSQVTIGSSGGDNGLRVDDMGVFNNNNGATFTINTTPNDQLFLDNTGSFNNYGAVILNNSADVGLYVTDDGVFTNMLNGTVTIMGSTNFGMQIDANSATASIVNDGSFSVQSGTNDGLRIQEGGVFTNNAMGMVSFMGSGDEAIQIDASGSSTFNNSGSVIISMANDHGMELFGTFNNLSGALFQAMNCGDDGIRVQDAGLFANDGDVRIDGSGSEDIETETVASFTNGANATFAPGMSPGDLEIRDDFDLGSSTTTFEIGGTAPATQFDQILNTVTANSITISSANFHLDWGSFVPSLTDCFKIIDGSGAVVGTATITSSNPSISYSVDYSSGTEVEICVVTILPVELTNFSAEKVGASAILNWETASEFNNEGFDIERSHDSQEWIKIGHVAGNGNSTQASTYSFTDEQPRNGLNYYRLKQIDFDGQFSYSDVALLDFGNQKSDVVVYPNPVNEGLYVSSSSEISELHLYDSFGRLLWIKKGNVDHVEFDGYASGIYFIRVISNSKRSTIKVVKM